MQEHTQLLVAITCSPAYRSADVIKCPGPNPHGLWRPYASESDFDSTEILVGSVIKNDKRFKLHAAQVEAPYLWVINSEISLNKSRQFRVILSQCRRCGSTVQPLQRSGQTV